MAKPIMADALWELIEPPLPKPKQRRRRYPGRKPIPHRAALTGIVYVLRTGIPWEYLPQEMGCGSGMACWRRLRDWQEAGVWEQIPRTLLGELRAADQIDWSRAVADSASLRALVRGARTGPNPTDRARCGSKHHLLTHAKGLPLAFTLTAANRHDVTLLLPLVDQMPPIAGKPGRPRRRPDCVQGDSAYDSQPHRRELRRRGIASVLAHRDAERGSGLGTTRWVVLRLRRPAAVSHSEWSSKSPPLSIPAFF